VEIAWVYPLNRMKKDTVHYTPGRPGLSPAWSEMVVFRKTLCRQSWGWDVILLSVHYGLLEIQRSRSIEATMKMTGPWLAAGDHCILGLSGKGYVIDHLNRKAFFNYARRTGNALKISTEGFGFGVVL